MPSEPVLRALARPAQDARAVLTLMVLSGVLSTFELLGSDLGDLLTDPLRWPARPWTLVTSALIHGHLLHLFFNLMLLWQLGRLVELIWGTLRTALFLLCLLAGTSAAQWALSGPSIGLSGVVYGLFGLLWAVDRWQEDKQGLMPPSTANLLWGWLVLCIVLTEAGLLRVANVAHASGALLGASLGWSLSRPRDQRGWRWFLFPALVLLMTLAGLFGRPLLNRSESRALELFGQGLRFEEQAEIERALAAFEQAAKIDPSFAEAWFNQGVMQNRLGRPLDAEASFRRAEELGFQPGR